MKKLISLALVAIMLFACIAAAVPSSALATAMNIQYVEAKYFDKKPLVDGYVTEAEWGYPVIEVLQDNAATKSDTMPIDNTYFTSDGTYDSNSLKMSFTAWFGWDENYFYIAAKVHDPDGHSLKNGRNETWKGDAIQTRIDPMGANAISFNGDFYPEDDPKEHKPWGDKNVCDLVFGYCQMAGGFKEAYNNTTNQSIISNDYYSSLYESTPFAVSPSGYQYTTDTANGITTYEIAVPWKYIDSFYFTNNGSNGINPDKCHEYYEEAVKEKVTGGVITQGPNGAIGREYGVTLAVYNADGNKGAGNINAGLTWGSGIINSQMSDALATCGGSNSVVLSADKLSDDSAYTGNYNKYTEGGMPTPPITPHYSYTIDESNYVKLTYDNDTDMDVLGYVANGERVQDTDGNWVVKWDKDTGLGDAPTESGYNETNYITTEGELSDGSDVRWTAKDASFTWEFDIKVNSLETFEEGYAPTVYSWFGGPSAVAYRCGYFFDDGIFKIADTSGKTEAESTTIVQAAANFSLNEWHHWVFQYDNETCVARFYFDPPMENGRVAQSAKPLFNISFKYFDYGALSNPFFIFRRLNCQVMLDNVELYNFVDYTRTGSVPPPPIQPGPGNPPKEITEVQDADIEVTKREDGTFAVSILNKEAYTKDNVKALSFAVTYDAAKLSYKAIEGIEEGKYTVETGEDGTLKITINDIALLKNIAAGASILDCILEPVDGADLTADEVKAMVTVKATITTLSDNTGDALVYISVALAAVLAIGTAVVFVYRRKKNTVQF